MKVIKKGFLNFKYFLLISFVVFFGSIFFIDNHIFFVARTTFIYPFLSLEHWAVSTIKDWSLYIESKHTLIVERNIYRNRSQELQGALLALKAQNIFLKETKELIEYKNKYENNENAKLAKVLLKHCDKDEYFFLINVGEKDGITIDSPVVYKNCLLGKVIEVYYCFSKVLLIVDHRCKVACFCEKTGASGIYEGRCSMDHGALVHVSHMQNLHNGDTLFSAGEGLVFPYGFGVGTIESFELEGIQYNIKVKPLVDFSTIGYCYVLPSQISQKIKQSL